MKLLLIALLAIFLNGISASFLHRMFSGKDSTDFNAMMNTLQKQFQNAKSTGGNIEVFIRREGFNNQNNNNPNPTPTEHSFFGEVTYPMPTQPPMQPATDAGLFDPITTDKTIPPTTTLPAEPVASVQNRKPQIENGKPKPQMPQCTKDRSAKGHTLCMEDSPDVDKARSGLTQSQKDAILDHHNRLRGTVDPAATDLVKLIWDDRVAAVAQKWAEQCQDGHDPNRELDEELGLSVGQNVAGGYRKFEDATQAWWDEIRFWKYGQDTNKYLGPGGWKKIGHFTQMAQNVTYLLGCGMAYCKSTSYKRHYVCNYANGQSNINTPYTKGRRCSACPGNCKKGSCDCGGLVCKNAGELDLKTCSCKCTKLYKGRECDELNCPAKDKRHCGNAFPPAFCDMFVNVPEDCPYMCGVCKGDGAKKYQEHKPTQNRPNGPKQKSEVFTSKYGCKYEGLRATPDECIGYGNKGTDKHFCKSMDEKNGQIGCFNCTQFANIPTQYCPVMCGLCDGPCDGLVCKNRGELDRETCTCKCKKPYTGRTCETVICKEGSHCGRYTLKYCDYTNIKADCPIKCGLCKNVGG